MPTYINPSAVRDHSITSVKLADNVIPTDASIAAMGYTKNTGTITGITMNGESQGTAGVVDLGNVVTGNARIFYGTCATAAATVNKVVTCETFAAEDLVKGALVFVTFDYTNSGAVANLTLDVNSTGAKPIKKSYTGTAVSDLSNAGELKSNVTYLFTYDGTNWVCITLDYNTNTTYSAMTQDEINAGTGTTGRRITPKLLRDNFYTETEVDSLLDAKADASAAIGSLSLGINSSNYQITLSGTKVDGTPFTVDSVIDLPLESVVVDGSYNNATKKVVLTLQSGSTVEFSVADLVNGLQSELTFDSSPAQNSSNPVTSGGIYTALQNKINSITVNNCLATGENGDVSVTIDAGDILYTGQDGDCVIVSGATINENLYQLDENQAELQSDLSEKYEKPSTGIPKTHLDASVQASLGKADTALQSESDPVYSTSPAANITLGDISSWNDKVSNVQADWDATTGLAVILNKPAISAAPGTLNTTATTAQSTSSNEALSGNITLHKVAKTGTYSDLIGTPTIPTVNNATLTIQKNGTNVQTFTANASSNVTANITVNELPTVTASDNGKVLMVVNGAWSTVMPVSIYSGSEAPNNSQGINGDLYLQI